MGPHPPGAPAARDHLLDDILLGGSGRLVDAEEFVEDFIELVGVLAIEEDVAVAGS